MSDRGWRFLGFCVVLALVCAGATTASAQVSCTGVPAWTDCCGCQYAINTQVVYSNSRYHARQTFTNTCGAGWNPAAVGSLWMVDGACGASATPTATTPPRATATTAPRSTATTAPRSTATATTAATATRTSAPTATATTSTGSCSVPAWSSTTAYNGGAQVSRTCGGVTNKYTAAFWTQGNDPCTSSGPAGSGQPWQSNGACVVGPTPTSGPTPTAGPTAPPGAVNLHHALYLMPFNNPIPIQQYMSETGLKSYMISFVLSNGGCTAAWDGTQPINSSVVSSLINTIRSNGGDIAISQGGYGGTKLGQACGSGSAAYSAIKAVVNMYAVKAVDFDIEEPEIENDANVSNELDAANLFANDGLAVSITLPTLTSGPNYFGGLTLDKAVAKGMCAKSNIHWRVMPFDGGFAQPGSTQTALQGMHDMIMAKCAWSDATTWSRLGVSGMIGRDDTGSFTSLSAWNTIVSFAKGKGMPDITTWAQQRDRPCTPLYGQVDPGTKGDCSSVTDPEGAFGKTLVN
jgi:hypothetical protein